MVRPLHIAITTQASPPHSELRISACKLVMVAQRGGAAEAQREASTSKAKQLAVLWF